MNWVLFLQFAGQLAGDVAASSGTNQRAVKGLQLLSALIGAKTASEEALLKLKAKYTAEVAADKPVSVDELDELDREIRAAHDRAQSGAPAR